MKLTHLLATGIVAAFVLQGCATLVALSTAERIPLREERIHRWDSTGSQDRMLRATLAGRTTDSGGPSLWKFEGADIWLLWPSSGNPVVLSDSRDSLDHHLKTRPGWDTTGVDTIDVYLMSDTTARVPPALLSGAGRRAIALWSRPRHSVDWKPAWALRLRDRTPVMEPLVWIGHPRFNPLVWGWVVVPGGVAVDVAAWPLYVAAWHVAQPALLPVAGGILALGFLVAYLMRDWHF